MTMPYEPRFKNRQTSNIKETADSEARNWIEEKLFPGLWQFLLVWGVKIKITFFPPTCVGNWRKTRQCYFRSLLFLPGALSDHSFWVVKNKKSGNFIKRNPQSEWMKEDNPKGPRHSEFSTSGGGWWKEMGEMWIMKRKGYHRRTKWGRKRLTFFFFYFTLFLVILPSARHQWGTDRQGGLL